MKKFKRMLIFLFVGAVLVFGACTSDSPEPEEPYYEEGEQEEEGYMPITTLPETIEPEYEDHPFTGYDIIVDGVPLANANFRMVGEGEIFPTHVPLDAVAQALGFGPSFWNTEMNEVEIETINGMVYFTLGEELFFIDGAGSVSLTAPAVEYDGIIYVPIAFFREVFGAGTAHFDGGHVFIATEGRMAR